MILLPGRRAISLIVSPICFNAHTRAGSKREKKKRPYLVSLVHELMRTSNELEPVDMVELGSHLVAKQPPGAARADSPRLDVFRVRPHQVAEGALVGDLLGAGHDADLVDGADLRAQAAVDAQDLAVDNGGQDEKVKDLAARLPDGRVAVLLLALLVEAVDLRDLPRLVVATDENDLLGISAVARVSTCFSWAWPSVCPNYWRLTLLLDT